MIAQLDKVYSATACGKDDASKCTIQEGNRMYKFGHSGVKIKQAHHQTHGDSESLPWVQTDDLSTSLPRDAA